WILQLPQPGPMAQAITFRAFGAGTPSFDTASEAPGSSLSVRFAEARRLVPGSLWFEHFYDAQDNLNKAACVLVPAHHSWVSVSPDLTGTDSKDAEGRRRPGSRKTTLFRRRSARGAARV